MVSVYATKKREYAKAEHTFSLIEVNLGGRCHIERLWKQVKLTLQDRRAIPK